jgi:hypothetical protein
MFSKRVSVPSLYERDDCVADDVYSPPNDVRIDCKAASHGDEDRGTPPADLDTELRAACRPSSVACSSAATAARANKPALSISCSS